MSRLIAFALAALLTAAPSLALAQSSPNWSYGYTPTAGEVRNAFATKQDLLNFSPLNLAGGTMRGKLNTAAATTNGAGFSILPGVAPTAATNGDIWLTSAGLFAQINGQPTNFLTSSSLGTMASQNANAVAITGGTINGTVIGGTSPAAAFFTGVTLSTPLSLANGGIGTTTLSGALDTAFSPTRGSVLYRGAAGWLTLAPGTSGNVLQTGGAGADPSWVAQSGGSSAYLPAPSTPSSNTTLVSGDAERPILATGSPTITMANGGAGWKTGPIRNSNTLTGLVTLAVPSGATLDGTTNGTVVLYPYQRARIIQTGTTAYVTDWIDRSPIIANVAQVGVASADFVLPAGYGSFEVLIRAAEPGTSGASMTARLSDDGGSTFKTGSADYGYETIAAQSTSMSSAQATGSSFPVIGAVTTGNGGGKARLEIDGNPSGLFPRFTSRSGATVGGSYAQQSVEGFCASISTNRVSAVRLLWSSGTGPINATVRAIP